MRGEITWTSRAAGLVQLGRRTSAGREAESGISPGVSLEGPRAAALKTTCVVTADTAATSHLVVTKGVRNTMTLGAGKLVTVQWDP